MIVPWDALGTHNEIGRSSVEERPFSDYLTPQAPKRYQTSRQAPRDPVAGGVNVSYSYVPF